MALKTMDSFLRYVTMGALATKQAWELLEERGYQIIELERYASSNKIWQTKIKRLRLPDLLCVKTGIRFEVRAKSNLKIEMSHAPGNPDRHWDAGMRDNDVVILIKAYDVDGDIRISNHINAFSISMLRSSQDNSRIGPPKSNSEGAERTITWPAWIPSSDGVVDEIQREADGNTRKIKVHYDDGRFYTYSRMDNKHVYLEEGERFKGNEQIILGLPQSLVSLDGTNPSWSPSNDLSSSNLSDQLASVKSFTRLDPMPVIEQLKQIFLDAQTDPRIRLETAGVLARHNIPEGLDFLSDQALKTNCDVQWRMEAVFILSEISLISDKIVSILDNVIKKADHFEARAAAAWGLGNTKAGLSSLLDHISDPDEIVAIHSIISASRLVDDSETTREICNLFSRDDRTAASASEVLSRSTVIDLPVMFEHVQENLPEKIRMWAFSSLSRRTPSEVRSHPLWLKQNNNFRKSLEYSWHGIEKSWLADRNINSELDALELQT